MAAAWPGTRRQDEIRSRRRVRAFGLRASLSQAWAISSKIRRCCSVFACCAKRWAFLREALVFGLTVPCRSNRPGDRPFQRIAGHAGGTRCRGCPDTHAGGPIKNPAEWPGAGLRPAVTPGEEMHRGSSRAIHRRASGSADGLNFTAVFYRGNTLFAFCRTTQ